MVDAASRFQIERKIATGGMGVVYQARDTRDGRLVALKQLAAADAELRQRFEREATVLAGLDHPAIVRYIAHGVSAEGAPYLAMDWIDGETLYERLVGAGVSVAESVELGLRLATGLAYAHARGVVHRDVKPSNVLLRGGDLAGAVIADFGIARGPGGTTSLTQTGALLGTPSYMAPEQARGERALGPRADVFALGCVLYECVTGRRAFEGRHALAVIAKVVLWEPPPARELDAHVPDALSALLAQMMAKPAERRPDGDAVIEALARFELAELRAHTRRAPASLDAADPTVPGRPTPVSLVLATTEAGADGSSTALPDDALAERRRVVAGLPELGPVRAEVLADGSIVVAITDADAARGARAAIACARAVRRAFPELLVAIASAAMGDPLLEGTVTALARDAMARMFAGGGRAGPPAGAIRIAPETAALVADEPILRIGAASYLAGGS